MAVVMGAALVGVGAGYEFGVLPLVLGLFVSSFSQGAWNVAMNGFLGENYTVLRALTSVAVLPAVSIMVAGVVVRPMNEDPAGEDRISGRR